MIKNLYRRDIALLLWFKKMIVRLAKLVADFVFPIYCAGCKREGTYCCHDCFQTIKTKSREALKNDVMRGNEESPPEPYCLVRRQGDDEVDEAGRVFQRFPRFFPPQQRTNFLDGVIAAAEFKERSLLAKLIHIFKYDFAESLSKTLTDLFNEKIEPINNESILVPVPLHFRRFNFRGFNQSMLLAQELSEKWGVQTKNILKRHRHTKPQVEFKSDERLHNVQNAFSMRNDAAPPNPLIKCFLMDDVCTTGATLNECAKVLKTNGAKQVYGLVIAKTM